jgi:hypothetical protein|tara:strand:- start:898 stop:1077 length:180 start_codon:yes stop_codon:yes gene_type:complete
MDIDKDKAPAKPIEECLENIKEIAFMVNDLKNDMLFIKSKIKEVEDNKGTVERRAWWLF